MTPGTETKTAKAAAGPAVTPISAAGGDNPATTPLAADDDEPKAWTPADSGAARRPGVPKPVLSGVVVPSLVSLWEERISPESGTRSARSGSSGGRSKSENGAWQFSARGSEPAAIDQAVA